MPFHYGDVVWADLDRSQGHEQTKRRPLVVVSNERYNRLCNLSMVVPITSKATGYPLHIDVGLVPGEEGAAPIRGFAEAEQLKALDLIARDAVDHDDRRLNLVGGDGGAFGRSGRTVTRAQVGYTKMHVLLLHVRPFVQE